MRISTVIDLIKEGIKNCKKTKGISINIIFIMALAFILFTSSVIIQANIKNTINLLEEQIEIGLILEDGLLKEQIIAIEEALKSIKYVKYVKFISKEEGLKELQKFLITNENSENQNLLEFEYNPLPNKFVIRVESPEYIDSVVANIKNKKDLLGIKEIINHKNLINKIINFTKGITTFFIGISIIMAVTAIVNISNSIKFNIQRKIKEIYVLNYIGATKMYIMFPYIVEGFVLSLISSIIAILVISLGYNLIITSDWQLNYVIDFLPMSYIYVISFKILSLSILLGVLFSYLSTLFIFRNVKLYEKKSAIIKF